MAAAAELGRDDDLPLPLGLADEQPRARDVDVDEVVVGAPGEHRVDHRAPLGRIVDPVHLRPRRAEATAPARVHVDDDVGEREEDRGEEVRELSVGRPLRVARERAVEVDAVRPEPRVRTRGLGRGAGHDEQPPGDVVRLGLSREPERGDLPLRLVAVHPSDHERRRPLGRPGDRDDRDEEMRPAAGVVRPRQLQPADLLAGRLEVDRAMDGRGRHPVGDCRQSPYS